MQTETQEQVQENVQEQKQEQEVQDTKAQETQESTKEEKVEFNKEDFFSSINKAVERFSRNTARKQLLDKFKFTEGRK